MKAYKIEIKLNQEQKVKVNKTLGVCKFVYNLYISKNQESYKEEKGFISGIAFDKWLNNEFLPNNPSYSWIREVSTKARKQAIMNGDKAFKDFFKGEKGYPKFKKRNSFVKAYFPKNNKTDLTLERHKLKIPTLGWVRLKEFGYIPLGSEIKSATVSKVADRYFVSVLVKEVTKAKELDKPQTDGIGVDLGLKEFAILSDGETFKNINKSIKIKKLEKKLRREQRSLSRKITKNKGKKGGANKKKNQLRVQKLHMRLANARQEYVRTVVNSLVSKNPKFIAIEDLNVKGMLKNKHLSKSIKESNFSYFRDFLIAQATKAKIEIRIIPRWYPSSKLCSSCGEKKTDLKLSDRTYKCTCGYTEDRDLNAAFNIRDCKSYQLA